MSSLDDRLKAKFQYVERCEWEMHEYQDLATEFLWLNKFCALFIDTGLGKTVIVLTLLVRLIQNELANKILIIAPVRVAAQTWPNEIAAWEHTAWLGYSVIRAEDDDEEVISAGQARKEELEAMPFGDLMEEIGEFQTVRQYIAQQVQKARTAKKIELRERRRNSPADIHIINREALQWLIDQHSVWKKVVRRGKVVRKREIVNWPYNVVVIDESSSFKDHNTARFKAISAVRQQLKPMKQGGWIDRLIELTATPAAEGYMGLFAQIFLLDKGKRLGRFITHYREEYFDHNKYAQTYKLKPGAKEAISDKIADLCLVMKSKDYLKEEEPLFLERTLDLAPSELRMYREFERDFILTLPDGEEIEAETAAALSQKLLQLASGAIYRNKSAKPDEDPDNPKIEPYAVVHDHKVQDLAELQAELEVSGEPLLVAYWFKSSLARLRKQFPKAAVMDKAGKIVSRHGPWNTGKVPMLLVHPASVGHGLNMQYGPGHDLYMFDMCWSYELFYQLYRRLHRQGQRRQVRIHLPQMRQTNDTLVWGRLREKEDAQEALFHRIRQMRRRFVEAEQMRMAA